MFDVKSFLTDYNIKHYTKGKNVKRGWVGVKCLFCDDESNHGGFNLSKQWFNCWRCGGKGFNKVIQLYADCDWAKAKQIIIDYDGEVVAFEKVQRKDRVDFNFEELKPIHKNYLMNRGFNLERLKKYNLKDGGVFGDFAYRVVMPVYMNDRLLTLTGRDITGKQNPYFNLQEYNSIRTIKECLYNIDNCRNENVILVEGPFDVLKMGGDCLCSFGIKLSNYQLKLLARYKKVDILFDSEKKAQEQAIKIAKNLSILGLITNVWDMEIENDPGSLNLEKAKEIKNKILGGKLCK